MQRGGVVDRAGVDVGALVEELVHRDAVAAFRGVEQRRAVTLRSAGDGRQARGGKARYRESTKGESC
jgi:hypothetical protein